MQVSTRRIRLSILTILLGLFTLTKSDAVQLVSAHANLNRSEPSASAILDTAPTDLYLWFTEAVEERFSRVQLLDQSGAEIADGLTEVRRDPADNTLIRAKFGILKDGVYTVVWQSLSAVDGHISAGSFAFVVGRFTLPNREFATSITPTATNAPSATDAPDVIARVLNYLSLVLLLGGFTFAPLIFQPALTSYRKTIAASKTKPAIPDGSFSRDSGQFRLLVTAWVLALAGTLISAVGQAIRSAEVTSLGGLGSALIDLLTATRYGTFFWLRLAFVLAIGALLVFRQSSRWQSRYSTQWWYGGIIFSILVIFTTSLNSHAAARSTLATASDLVHLIAIGVWIGGLPVMLLALRWLRRADQPEKGNFGPGRFLVSRFSQIATLCVMTLAATGLINSVVEVGDIANLLDTQYGQILLLKLAVVLPLVAIGGINFLFTRRRLDRTANAPELVTLQRFMRRTVGVELILMIAVLAATGILTGLIPARDAFGTGVVVRSQIDDLRVVVSINPGISGINTFDVYVRDFIGVPVDDAKKVALQFSMMEHDMGVSEATAENLGDGHYRAQGGYMSMFGTWRTEVLIRRGGLDDVRVPLVIPISASVRAPRNQGLFSPLLLYPSRLLIGIELLIASLLVIAGAGRLGRIKAWAATVSRSLGAVLLIISVYVGANAFVNGADPTVATQNPISATSQSLADGKLMFEANCSICHGNTGAGDGELAAKLNPPPANLRIHLSQGHTDGQLFEWITYGIDNSAMPAFGGRLTEEQRWNIINYIKTFVQQP